MVVFSLRVVVPIRGYHMCKETWELNFRDCVTFEWHNGKRLPVFMCIYITCRSGCVQCLQLSFVR